MKKQPIPKNNPKLTTVAGYDYVKIGGITHYLGKHGTAKTKQKYLAALADPEGFLYAKNPKAAITVKALIVAYLKERDKRQMDSKHYHNEAVKNALLHLFPGKDADSMTYRDMILLRDYLVNTPSPRGKQRCRHYINDLLRIVKNIFRFGNKLDYVSDLTLAHINRLEQLKAGESAAVESNPREAVPIPVVDKTLPHCTPIVADMIRVSILTVARPGELESMTPNQIHKDEEVESLYWYRPTCHKLKHKGKKREIPLFRDTMAILEKYLSNRLASEPVFSHSENHVFVLETMRAARKSKITPSQQKRDEGNKHKPKRKINRFFNKDTFHRNVEKAIEQANFVLPKEEQLPHWTPYQLRHTANSWFRDPANGGSRELAEAVAGHNAAGINDRYNHSQKKIIRDYARRLKSDGNPATPPPADTANEALKDEKIAELLATIKTLTSLLASDKPELKAVG